MSVKREREPMNVTIHASGLIEISIATYDHSFVRDVAKRAGYTDVVYVNTAGEKVKHVQIS